MNLGELLDPCSSKPFCVAFRHAAPTGVGGLLHELYKGSGSTSMMANWRSIMCSNSGSKRLHAMIRPRLFHFADGWLSDSQCGGTPGVGIDFSSHTVKSSIDLLYVCITCFFFNVIMI